MIEEAKVNFYWAAVFASLSTVAKKFGDTWAEQTYKASSVWHTAEGIKCLALASAEKTSRLLPPSPNYD